MTVVNNSTGVTPPFTVDAPQRKEVNTTQNTNNDASSEIDQASQEAIANLLSMSVVTSMIQGSSMTKNAMSKGNQGLKELMAEIAEEEEDRKTEDGIPAY
ncbi:MAG: hypothetical protein V3V19_10895 [Cocleimonas sp.]